MNTYLTEDKSDILLHYKFKEYADRLSGRHNDVKSKHAKKLAYYSNLSSLRNSKSHAFDLKNDMTLKKQSDEDNNINIKEINKKLHKLDKLKEKNTMEKFTLEEVMDYIDNYLTEATVTKKKQKILDNQDDIKKNFNKIADDLKKILMSNAGDYNIKIKDSKFYKDHEDHREQHYLLIYSIEKWPIKELQDKAKNHVAKILLDIGNKTEKEFKKYHKDFLDKGLYFDNEKKDDNVRFVELHYDFY